MAIVREIQEWILEKVPLFHFSNISDPRVRLLLPFYKHAWWKQGIPHDKFGAALAFTESCRVGFLRGGVIRLLHTVHLFSYSDSPL